METVCSMYTYKGDICLRESADIATIFTNPLILHIRLFKWDLRYYT